MRLIRPNDKRLWLASALALTFAGCLADESTQSGDEVTTQVNLFDTLTPDATAVLGLRDAQRKTFLEGNAFEFCGLIIKKPLNGGFRGTGATTSGFQDFCSQQTALLLGETVVGYYHSHPAGIDPDFSKKDKDAARSSRRIYYVVGSDNCRRRYDWQTGRTTLLGCG